MNYLEKRYKIKQVEKYKKDLKSEKRDAILFSMCTGVIGVVTIGMVTGNLVVNDISGLNYIITLLLGTESSLLLMKTVDSVIKKANLETRIEEIEDQLSFIKENNEENQVRKDSVK